MSTLNTYNLKSPDSANTNIALDASGNIAVRAGSAASPSIYITGDANTGLYSPGADQIAVSTGGTQRLLINETGILEYFGGPYRFYRYGSIAPNLVGRVSAGTQTSPTAITSAGVTGVGLFGNSYDGSTYQTIGGISVITEAATTNTSSPGYIAAFTTPSGSTTQLERLRITADGKLGLGTSSPSETFHVIGTGLFTGSTQFNNGIRLTAATQNYIYFDDALSLTRSGVGDRLTIDSSGRVGIGTTPSTSLDISGVITSRSDSFAALRFKSAAGVDKAFLSYEDGSTAVFLNNYGSGPISFKTADAERCRVDASGRLLVGTSSVITVPNRASTSINPWFELAGNSAGTSTAGITAFFTDTGFAPALTLAKSNNANVGSHTAVADGTALGELNFAGSNGSAFLTAASISSFADGTVSGGGANDMPGRLVFSVTRDGQASPTERLRIGNAGVVQVYDSSSNGLNVRTESPSGTGANLLAGYYSATSTTTGTNCFVVFANGNVQNTNNSYGALSDIKLKENIVDANSQWDDLKALQVRKYNFKEGQTHTQIGLVAQEVELVSPGLVTESPDRDAEGNDLGTVTKSVNYSVLYMKAVKALQEAMERIEQLEAKVSVLESKP